MAEETKIIYHIDDEETPYLVKISKPPDQVTLLDFKTVLNRPNYKFFFKSMDDDFGVVKEEIIEDDAPLPCFNGRVVSWVVPPDDEHASDAQSVRSNEKDRSSNAGSDKPHIPTHPSRSKDPRDFDSEVESVVSRRSSRRSGSRRHESDVERSHRRPGHSEYDSSSMMSSDLETTSFVDSDDESRFSSVTGSSRYVGGRHRRRRRKHRMPRVERCSSFSTITESTMSLNIITVTLNMDKINFLGISIVGQSNKRGDGGIYVGSVMKGGAVDADGRVEPGDMLLAVNDVNFENMSNDDAVRVLREAVHKPGPITLTVAKCWDPSPKGYFTVPRNEPVRPIDPSAWIQHSEAVRAAGGLGRPQGAGSPSLSTMTSTSSSLTSSIPEADRYIDNPDGDLGLTIHSDMGTIVKAMMSGESGLDVRDRMWLKITIPNAFIGSDVVDWLFTHVEGFSDRREARKYASKLLKAGYFRHTVNKITFSEQCYYVFGDLTGAMAGLSISDIDSTLDQDTLAPLPGSKSQLAWNAGQPPSVGPTAPPPSYSQIQYYPPVGFAPHPAPMVGYPQDGQQMVYPQFFIQHPAMANSVVAPSHSSGSHKSGSQKEVDRETVRSSGSSERSASSKGRQKKPERDTQSLRESDTQSLRGIPVLPDQISIHSSVQSVHSAQGAPIDDQDAESLRDDISVTSTEFAAQLGNLPPGLSDSRQSFRMAMGNPMNEFFVDVM